MGDTTQTAPGARRSSWYRRAWLHEAMFVLAVYLAYSFVRNQFGSGSGDHVTVRAFDNARRVLRVEDWLHVLNEPDVQDFTNSLRLLPWLTAYYGIAHFVVTIGVAVWLYHRHRRGYKRFRLAIAFSTACAAVTFATFPLMPPRLLAHEGRYGGAQLAREHGLPDYGFDDSLETHKGPWNYEAGPMAKVSNQFAAMPSLHAGWAFSCALVLAGSRRRWLAAIGVAHAFLTTWAVVATANHYWLDVVAGAVLAVMGALVACVVYRGGDDRPRDANLSRPLDDTIGTGAGASTPEAVR